MSYCSCQGKIQMSKVSFLMCGRTAAIYSSVCPGLSFWSPWCCFSLLAVKSNTTAINSFPAFVYQQAAGIVAPEMNVISAISTQHKCCLTGVATQTLWFLLSGLQRSLILERGDDAGFGGFPLDFCSSTTSCYEWSLTLINMGTYIKPRFCLSSMSDRPATGSSCQVLERVTVETRGHSFITPQAFMLLNSFFLILLLDVLPAKISLLYSSFY